MTGRSKCKHIFRKSLKYSAKNHDYEDSVGVES